MASIKTKKSHPNKEQPISISIGINRVELIDKFLDCSPFSDTTKLSDLRYKIHVDTIFIADKSTIQITVDYTFLLMETVMFTMKVENDFDILGFSKLGEKVKNEKLLTSLIGLSINHARGIQSTLIKNTPIANMYIPPITDERIVSQFIKK